MQYKYCLLAFGLLVSLLVTVAAEEDYICPPYSDLPWYQNDAFAPFTWCKSGDVARIAQPISFTRPKWADDVACTSDGTCKSIIHVETFDHDGDAFLALAFVADPTKILLTRTTVTIDGQGNSTIDVQGPIKRFSTLFTSVTTHGFLVMYRNGTWAEALTDKVSGESQFVLTSLRPLNQFALPGWSVDDAVSFIDEHYHLGYALSMHSQAPQDRKIAFVQFSTGLPFAPHAYVNITNAPQSLTLGSWQQQAENKTMNHYTTHRSLVTLHDFSTVHVLVSAPVPPANAPTVVEEEFDWTDPKSPSAVHHVTDPTVKIWHVDMFSEVYVRQGVALPLVWLSVVYDLDLMDNKQHSRLHVRQFPEWGQQMWPANSSMVDPLGIGHAPCDFNVDWFHSGACISRPDEMVFITDDGIIADLHARAIPQVNWLVNFFPPEYSISNWTTSSVNYLFFIERDFVQIIAMQPYTNETLKTKIELANSFTLLGKGNRLAVSDNGLHALPVVLKNEWEMESINRFADICDMVRNVTNQTTFDQAFLEVWKVPCAGNYRRANAEDFMQYLGLCPMGAYCPYSTEWLVGGVYPGYYSPVPLTMKTCPKGWYCPFGIQRLCPSGFICPHEMSLLPTPCPPESLEHGLTCFKDGLSEPIPAPSGTIPRYAQAPPFPAPPGYFATHNPDTGFINMSRCESGEYCPLARDQMEDRLCPAGTFCPTTNGILPTQCAFDFANNYCSYCPEGSTNDSPCPAGFYCPRPDIVIECVAPYYCPPGTLSPSLCEPGYYCPTPAERKICPNRHYCELGTTVPAPCAILSICPEGTKNNSANFILSLVFVVFIAVLVTVWRILEHRTTKKRLERSQKMQEAERLLQRAKLQNQASGANVSGPNINDDDYSEPDSDMDDADDAHASLLGKDSPAALAALINRDLNSRMTELPFRVDISFRELGLKIKGTEKKVLDGVTGTIRSGRVTAVMGPSGAGKTTFMSTLANKAHYGDRTGTILLNGQKGDLTSIQKLVGFVPQDDVMLRELSVTEILSFNAKMRLPAELPEEAVTSIVRKTIRLLGLYDIRHELIGDETKRGISGGQRKRVNIGMELVAQPTVLFLDEPTSGLDSSASLDVCGILRRVAEEAGMTVISVIHQPRYDIFTMFHDVLLLGKGGRTVYLGPTKDAVKYFSDLGFEMPTHCNPADFLIDVVSGAVPRKGFQDYVKEDLFQLWIDHQKAQQDDDFATDAEITDSESSMGLEDDHEQVGRINASGTNGFGAFTPQKRTSSSSKTRFQPKPIKMIEPDAAMPFVIPAEGQRVTSSPFHQFWYFFVRSLVQQKRNWISILTDVILVVVSAITFGIVFLDSHYIGPPAKGICDIMPVSGLRMRCSLPIDDPFPQIALMTTIGLALPAAMAALRIFGSERVVFWRESSVGANTASYYLGKEFGFLPSSILLPLLYAGVFYNFTVPRMNFGLLYLIFLATWWCATGLALVVSILVPPSLATISTVVVVFGMSMFSGVRPTLLELKKMWPPFSLISYVSFFRWLTEAYYISEIWQWRNLYNIFTGLEAFDYHITDFPMCIGIVLGMGLGFRIIALVLLEVMNRDQRR